MIKLMKLDKEIPPRARGRLRAYMQILARADFERGLEPRFTNKPYLDEFGTCYAIAEAHAHYNRGAQ